jgi:putative methionine-R-sulfoxide reductase with GAF domain
MANCPEYDRLHAEVENVLGNLAQVSTLLVELFRSNDFKGVHRLDKQMELTLGEKERRIGAFSQHVREHKCVAFPEDGDPRQIA